MFAKTLIIYNNFLQLPGKSIKGLPKPLNENFFETNKPLTSNENFDPDSELPYLPLREVTCRTELQPGFYCIIVSTSSTNKAGEYLLRIFSDKSNKTE